MSQCIAIAPGNSKLGNIPNICLIPGKDCGDVPCKKDCYALKAWRQYEDTRNAWSRNSRMAHNNPDSYFSQVRRFLAKKRPTWFRWHVAGDILDQAYLETMKEIARELPAVRFLAFTKRHELEYKAIPKNLAIILSLWPSWGELKLIRKVGLPLAWMQDGTETRVPKNAIACPGDCEHCGMCWHLKSFNRDVVFAKH